MLESQVSEDRQLVLPAYIDSSIDNRGHGESYRWSERVAVAVCLSSVVELVSDIICIVGMQNPVSASSTALDRPQDSIANSALQ